MCGHLGSLSGLQRCILNGSILILTEDLVPNVYNS